MVLELPPNLSMVFVLDATITTELIASINLSLRLLYEIRVDLYQSDVHRGLFLRLAPVPCPSRTSLASAPGT